MKVAGRNSDAGGGSAMADGEITLASSVQGLGATVFPTEGTRRKRGRWRVHHGVQRGRESARAARAMAGSEKARLHTWNRP